MIEKTIIGYLSKSVGVPVYAEIPEEPEDSYVIIDKTGSGLTGGVLSATIAVQSYGATMQEAAELNEEVKKIMLHAHWEVDTFYGVHLNSDYNFTDTSMKRYRYQAVFNINYYEEEK